MGGKDDRQDTMSDRYVYTFGTDTSDTDTDTSRTTHRRRRLDDPEAEIKRRREKLNNDIVKEVGLDVDGKSPLNVAIIGPAGAGKSSTINTLLTAMNKDKYREYAIAGNFGGQARQVTYLTKSFPKGSYKDPVHPDACYPTLIDIAGFDDIDNDLNRELLRIVFFGRLPVEDSLKSAEEEYRETGMTGLRKKYSQNEELLKVDRIIFVASARENIPKNLIQCVISAANPAGAKAGKGKMTIPVFGILTKIDGVDLESSDFKEKENTFLSCLGLIGAKQRYAKVINYCSDVDEEDERLEKYIPRIDVPALKFLRQVLDPVYEVQAGDEKFTDARSLADPPKEPKPTPNPEPAAGLVLTMGPETPVPVLLLTYALKGIIIALFVNICLAPSISSSDLLSICTTYDQHRSQHPNGFSADRLTSICDRKMEIIGKSLMGPLLVFVLLIVLLDFFVPRFMNTLMRKLLNPRV